MENESKTGFVWHEIYMWHDTSGTAGLVESGAAVEPYRHYESPEAKRRIRNLLEVSGLLDELQPIKTVEVSDEDILRVHTPAYLQEIKSYDGKSLMYEGETKLGAASVKIARLSAGGALAAVKTVVEGQVQNAYALTRPPGHHAEPDKGGGFCIFANIAIAAAYARACLGVGRVAVIDWDVHHGNGTEACFYDNPEVLTISLHQDGLFPLNRGSVQDSGSGPGVGKNINIPLPPGSGEGAYRYAFETVVLPALEAFAPELIIVACGFDSSIEDPLGRMMLTSDDYRMLTARLKDAAKRLCNGRLVIVHEGGYNPITTPYLGLAVAETLSDRRTGVKDPFIDYHAAIPGRDLQPGQQQAADAVAAYHRQCTGSPLYRKELRIL